MEPPSISRTLLVTNERLIEAAFPEIADLNTLHESEAIPRLATLASQLCANGDADVCHVMRTWLWDGILTMLVDMGFDLGLGGPEAEQCFADFVLGQTGAALPKPPSPAEVLTFRPRSPQ